MKLATTSLVLVSAAPLLVSAADLSAQEDKLPSCSVSCYTDYLEDKFGDPDAWKQGCSPRYTRKFAIQFSECTLDACSTDDYVKANEVSTNICVLENLGRITGSGNGAEDSGEGDSDGGDSDDGGSGAPSDSSNDHKDGAGVLYNKSILLAAVAMSGATAIFGLLA